MPSVEPELKRQWKPMQGFAVLNTTQWHWDALRIQGGSTEIQSETAFLPALSAQLVKLTN